MNVTSARISGTEMLAVAAYSAKDGMCAPNRLNFCSELVGSGRYPIRFEYQINRNRAPRYGNHLAASESDMFPRVMLSRISENRASTAVCTRLGRICIRSATHTIVTTVKIAAKNR